VNVIFILIAVSLLVAIGFLVSFIWSIRTGQYDDEYTPSVRILFDDEKNIIDEKTEVRSQKSGADGLTANDQEPRTKNQEPRTNNQEPITKN
jgi:cbb3-type cytochrome oxidase maturation protein